MLFSEMGRDLSDCCIMFAYLSPDAQRRALEHMQVTSHYELDWDVIPIAHLPGGTIKDYDQDDIDLQALMQIGCYR